MANLTKNVEPTQTTPAHYLKARGAGTTADPFIPAETALAPLVVIQVSPPLETSLYHANDLMFDSVVISNAAFENGGVAILDSVTLIDTADVGAAITLIVADSMVDFGTSHSAPTVSAADAMKIVATVPIVGGDYVDLGSSKVACKGNLGIGVKCTGSSQSLALAGVILGVGTYTASALTIKLGFRQG